MGISLPCSKFLSKFIYKNTTKIQQGIENKFGIYTIQYFHLTNLLLHVWSPSNILYIYLLHMIYSAAWSLSCVIYIYICYNPTMQKQTCLHHKLKGLATVSHSQFHRHLFLTVLSISDPSVPSFSKSMSMLGMLNHLAVWSLRLQTLLLNSDISLDQIIYVSVHIIFQNIWHQRGLVTSRVTSFAWTEMSPHVLIWCKTSLSVHCLPPSLLSDMFVFSCLWLPPTHNYDDWSI